MSRRAPIAPVDTDAIRDASRRRIMDAMALRDHAAGLLKATSAAKSLRDAQAAYDRAPEKALLDLAQVALDEVCDAEGTSEAALSSCEGCSVPLFDVETVDGGDGVRLCRAYATNRETDCPHRRINPKPVLPEIA